MSQLNSELEASVMTVMNRRDEKKKAWEDWHGDLDPDDIPSQINPSFDVGFDMAWDAMVAEVRHALTSLDSLADLWGDEAIFRRCRDRLRDLTRDA